MEASNKHRPTGLKWDVCKAQCIGEELERARRMVRFLKASKKTGVQISADTGLLKATAQRFIADPPGTPSRKSLKILESVYGEQ